MSEVSNDTLRPKTFNDITGQSEVQEYLRLKVRSAKQTQNPMAHTLLLGPGGTGKAQPLTAKVLTPNGFVLMGNIHVGSQIIGSSGTPVNVVGVFPQGEKDIFEVKFSDGSKTRCCKEHLWKTYTTVDRIFGFDGSIKDTQTIMNSLQHQGSSVHTIPIVKPVNFDSSVDVPLDSYLVGVLLGDGSFADAQRIRLSTADTFIYQSVMDILAPNMTLSKVPGKNYDYRVVRSNKTAHNKKGYEQNINTVCHAANYLGLSGMGSHTKFIPDCYKYASVADRIALLQGMMDTDGYCNGKEASYCTVSYQMAQDFQFLVQSLGGTAIMTSANKSYKNENFETVECKLAYNINVRFSSDIMPFRLPRKVEKYSLLNRKPVQRYIKSVNYIGRELSQCIKVDAEDELYVTDDFIVTHNTTLAHIIANEMGKKIITIAAQRISSSDAIVNAVMDLDHGDIVYIDEIHSLGKKVQEGLYDIMEDFKADIETGRGRDKRMVKVDLPRFTLIGSTTHEGKLNAPLLRRFGYKARLSSYTFREVGEMVKNASIRHYGEELPGDVADAIGFLSRRSAATGYSLLQNFHEVNAVIGQDGGMTPMRVLHKVLMLEKIDPFIGLDFTTRKYLKVLARTPDKTISLQNLASQSGEQIETILDTIEPFVMGEVEIEGMVGPLVEMHPKGRKISELGQLYMSICKDLQKEGWFQSEEF